MSEVKMLVCWYKLDENTESNVKSYLDELLKKEGKQIVFSFIYNQQDLKNELKKKDYSYIIVLCELDWEGHKPMEFFGIELVQKTIRLSNENASHLPVLFLSLESNKYITKDGTDFTRLIINTYGIGHQFIQVTCRMNQESLPNAVSRFWEMEKRCLTDNELNHAKLYCNLAGMVGLIKHNIDENNLEKTKLELLNLISKIPAFDDNQFKKIVKDIENVDSEKSEKHDFNALCERLRNVIDKIL